MNSRRIIALATAAVVSVVAVIGTCTVIVGRDAALFETSSPALVPPRPVGIIFGAGLNPDGTPSGMLADRLNGGIVLLRRHVVHGLLLTGDNGTVEYNELAAMRAYAIAHGVASATLTEDYAGFDTYDSCFRARAIFHIHSAVLVTQAFHLPRALYICRKMGIDAVGLAEPDWSKYGRGMMLDLTLREYLARAKAVFDVETHRRATLLGPAESVNLSRD